MNERHRSMFLTIVGVATLLFGVLLVLAVRDLAGGPAEILNHWWSAVALIGFLGGLAVVVSTVMTARRDQAHDS